VFNNPEKLELLNSIVHPVVIQDAVDWANTQTSCYSLKEAALLFESGSYKTLDYTILVVAPEELRIERVMNRDGVSREEVLNRINKQMPEEEKRKLADFIIVNDGIQPLIPQLYEIHKQLIRTC
jgi:dephospho-CoA kinase